MRIPLPLFLFCWAIGGGSVRADIALAPLFSDHAVLQRDKPIAIWGRAEAGEKIVVTFLDQNIHVTATRDGRWIAFLEPVDARSEGTDLVVTGNNRVVLHDIVVGEVWLCAGSSGVERRPSSDFNPGGPTATADFPQIRQVRIEPQPADSPSDAVPTSGWQRAVPGKEDEFAATGFFFAKDLVQKLGVPVGLVYASSADSPIESWLSPFAFVRNPAFAVTSERRAARPEAASEPAPAALFNGMINPLLPYALRGVLWSEGENIPGPQEYQALFAAMVAAWRGHFGQGDFPIYWVQSPRRAPSGTGAVIDLAKFREAQAAAIALPNTGQAIAIDLDADRDKASASVPAVIGRRLALLAKNRIYGITSDDSGPTFIDATREGSSMRVRLAHATSGLVAHDKPVQSLELAGPDKVFRAATARIERESLLVSSPEVRMPVAVRYAWRNAPPANLYNGAGLPAEPFRSDDW